MGPNHPSVEIRPRQPWEAIDLGVSMTRHWWREVYALWFALTLPLFVIVNIALSDHPGWAMLLLWWLKPLYDRVLLQFYADAVFGQQHRLGHALAGLPGLLRGTGLWLHLSVYRLDPARSLRLPVWQLEGLRGRVRIARYRLLAQRAGGYAVWLTVVGWHLELFMQFALLGLVWLFTPSLVLESIWQQAWNLMSNSDWPYWFYLCLNVLQYLVMSIIEPLYVAGGFGLYLNRRTQLEGWDLEIRLRRLGDRLKQLSADARPGDALRSLAMAMLLGTALLGTLAPAPSQAAELPRLAPDQAEPVMQQVLANKDFGGEREVQRWRLKEPYQFGNDEDDDAPNWEFSLGYLPEILKWLLWAAAALLLYKLVVFIANYRSSAVPTAKAEPAPPATISGLDIRPQSLPDDIAAAARALWLDGHYREALSLAYRGAVSALVHRYHVELRDSATEGDVQHAARRKLSAASDAFLTDLTGLWQRQAYAHQRPDDDAVLAMLADWEQHFGAAAPMPTPEPSASDGREPPP